MAMAVDSGVSPGEGQSCEALVSLWLDFQDQQERKKPFHRMDAIRICQAHLPALPCAPGCSQRIPRRVKSKAQST